MAASTPTIERLELQTGPWRTVSLGTELCEMSHRYVGQVILSDGSRHTIVQRERRELWASCESTYVSQILYGNLVSDDEQGEIFERTPHGLWCANCFTDDMYGTGEGAVTVPYWMRGRYFSKLTLLQPCTRCNCRPHPFELKTIVLPANHAYVFRARSNPVIQAAIEAALAARGITSAKRFHTTENPMSVEMQQEIVAEALHPKRIESYLARGGFEALEALAI